MIDKRSKIYVAGHRGLVGSAILNNLRNKGYTNLIFKSHSDLDLTDQYQVQNFFKTERPEYVILAAAKVGGILANNTYRADFIYENLMIQSNVIHQSYLSGVKKLLFLGSTCIYPKYSNQPICEDNLLTSELEYTNEPYAIAKIAGIKMCESYNIQYNTNFLCVMPTNLYGPSDNFDLERSHVLPALLRKIHLGKCLDNNDWKSINKDLEKNPINNINKDSHKEDIISTLAYYGVNKGEVRIWGSGAPKREFLWSEDMADACIFLFEKFNFKDICNPLEKELRNTHINIGTGVDFSIKDLANKIKLLVGYTGEFIFDSSKPDGVMQKVTDTSKMSSLGWQYRKGIDEGIKDLYNSYLSC
tara:strand:- start:2769 stop:3845 length:1077 start_codon:yes stop_codon:yes gene_type:complete